MRQAMCVSFCSGETRLGLLLAVCFVIVLFGPAVMAAEPQQLATAELGDCAACHGGDAMVPAGHLATKGVKLAQCLTCHKEEDPKLTNTMPLSHSHQLSGVNCAGCHGETAPPAAVNMETCVKCHPIDDIVAKTMAGEEGNPHQSHYGPELDCNVCHHAHKKSENFCAQCHYFEYVTPSPIEKPKKKVTKVEAAAAPAPAPPAPAPVPARCESCHSGAPYKDEFPDSSHGVLCCTSCHLNVGEIGAHVAKTVTPGLTPCASCHGEIAGMFEKDYHAVKAGLTCLACHGNIHALKKREGDLKKAVQEQCTTCHDKKTYVELGHGKSVLAGNADSAACSDCHGLHNVPVYDRDTEQGRADKREHYTEICKSCHGDRELAERNNLNLAVVEEYDETYHGKVLDIGYSERIAGCADCHNGHNILPADDPRSTINAANLVNDCKQCHEGFHARFVLYEAHPDYGDRARYPALYWTNVFMIGLLIFVFLFFWVHTILWWRKSYWEKWKTKGTATGEPPLSKGCEPSQYVRRFSLRDRCMHLLLIISFFTLVLTGFPLKYHDTAWARALMTMWGGVKWAGMFHRIAAFILILLFLYTCWLSLKFLFPKRKARGWVGRLFGPESLCFNLKDWEDMKGMIRWFFNRGEMPRFERWTYWEKFDYFAVFWGMFVIGLSGLMLWMPELSSYIFPGWMISVATVAHSEEAFLAAIFIFTVHFFHNHLVPNKFPMESNIFTGRYTVEALKEERAMEYDRIVRENRLEAIKRDPPGVFIQLLGAFIGIGSVLLGLLLTFLIFWAVLFY